MPMDETPGAHEGRVHGSPDEFHRDLHDLGFRFVQEGRRGVLQFAQRTTRYLTVWVHHDPGAGTVLMTFEHAIGEFLETVGLQVGSNEPLNQFLFPRHDVRGRADIGFVVAELDRIEAVLRGIDLLAD